MGGAVTDTIYSHSVIQIIYFMCRISGRATQAKAFWQEPGLRPIGVPDKTRRSLGNMSRYSAQILLCYSKHVPLFNFSVG